MNVLLIRPIINLLLLLYQGLGHQTILAIVAVTAIFRLALTPLARTYHIQQQKVMHNQHELRVRLAIASEKYQDDPEKLALERLKLYQEAQLKPLGGCFFQLIQLILMIGVYQGVMRVLAVTPHQLLALPRQIYPWLPNLGTLIPVNSRFLWLDLALRDPYLILPALVFATSWWRQTLLSTGSGDSQASGIIRYLPIAMPLLIAGLSTGYAAGLALYLLTTNLIGIVEHYVYQRSHEAGALHQPGIQPTANGA